MRIRGNSHLICTFLLITVIFFCPSYCKADALNDSLVKIVQDFERHIGSVSAAKKYYVVVRSFVDSDTNKPKKISREIEGSIVDIVIERFRGRKNIVVLERKRLEAIEKEVAFETDQTHFEEGMWQKKLGKKLGAGFLITGSISKLGKYIKIRAKMIDIVTGEILASSSARVRIDEIEKALLDDYGEESTASVLKHAKNIMPEVLFNKKWLLLLVLLVIVPLVYVNRKKFTQKNAKTAKDFMLNDVTATKLKFFQYDESNQPLEATNRFAKSTSGYIYSEIFLIHPTPGRKINFTMNIIYYDSEGDIMGSMSHDSYIEESWSTSYHEWGWGWEEAGNWKADDYRVDLFIEGKKMISGSFTIYED